jgi:hypothetical protein
VVDAERGLQEGKFDFSFGRDGEALREVGFFFDCDLDDVSGTQGKQGKVRSHEK